MSWVGPLMSELTVPVAGSTAAMSPSAVANTTWPFRAGPYGAGKRGGEPTT
jgi:hypothetical protein